MSPYKFNSSPRKWLGRTRFTDSTVNQQNQALLRDVERFRRKCRELEGDTLALQREVHDLQAENRKSRQAMTVSENAIQEKNHQIRKLQQEILQYKTTMSTSTRLENQLSDTTIQGAMNGLFYAVRDWALNAVRHEKDVLDHIDDGSMEWLHKQVPGGKEGSSARKANSLIALFSYSLLESMNQDWVFGAAYEDPSCAIASANRLYTSIEALPSIASTRKKQWVLLTNEFLSKNQNDVVQSQKEYANAIACQIREILGYDLDHTEFPIIVYKLWSAIEPHIQIVQSLNHQEADYFMGLPIAAKGEIGYLFDEQIMEDVNGEDKGMLEASIFPAVIKETMSDDGTKMEQTVVFKAKVVVES